MTIDNRGNKDNSTIDDTISTLHTGDVNETTRLDYNNNVLLDRRLKNNDAIDTASNDIMNQQLTILNTQSARFSSLANFNQVKQNTNLMIPIAPSQPPRRYLSKTKVSMLPGNSYQCRQVDPKEIQRINHPTLFYHPSHVWKNENDHPQRFDIIGGLPCEVIELILQKLNIKDKFKTLDVSNVWRHKISACSQLGWSKLELRECDVDRSKLGMILQQIGFHVTCLRVCYFQEPGFYDTVFDEMSNHKLEKLEEFIVECSDFQNIPRFINAVSNVAKTLKVIEIKAPWVGNDRHVIPLKTILTLCPCLKTLRYRNFAMTLGCQHSTEEEEEKEVQHIFPSNMTSSLTTLDIEIKHMTTVYLEQLLAVSPYLTYLNLILMEWESDIVDMIHHQCKSLQQFCFNLTPYNESDDKDNVLSTKGSGVRDASIKITYPNQFVSFLMDHSTTIRTLDLSFSMDDDVEDQINELQDEWRILRDACHFSELRSFTVTMNNSLCDILVIPLLQKAPHIHTLRFCDSLLPMTQELRMTLVHLPHLKKLAFSGNLFNHQEMQQLFQMFATKTREESILEEVEFSCILHGELRMIGVLELLGDISSLSSILLSNIKYFPVQEMIRLFEKLHHHPSIRSIRLCRIDCIDDTMLYRLAAIKGLERLTLEYMSNITRYGLNTAFEGSLIKVTTKKCKNV